MHLHLELLFFLLLYLVSNIFSTLLISPKNLLQCHKLLKFIASGIRLAATRKAIPAGLLLGLSVSIMAVTFSAYLQDRI